MLDSVFSRGYGNTQDKASALLELALWSGSSAVRKLKKKFKKVTNPKQYLMVTTK